MTTTSTDQHGLASKEEFEAEGFNSWVAIALVGREQTLTNVRAMAPEEILDEVLCWSGIIGYSRLILDAVDNIHSVAD